MSIPSPAHILVIDEIPLIAVGLQEVFRTIHPNIRLEYTESPFTALSSPAYEGTPWYLIVLGAPEHSAPGSLLLPAAELKEKFAGCRIMFYTDTFDPLLIEKVRSGVFDACVHKHEGADEIVRAWRNLSSGKAHISPKFT